MAAEELSEVIDLTGSPADVKIEDATPAPKQSVLRPEREDRTDPAKAAREAAERIQLADQTAASAMQRAERAERAAADAQARLANAGKTVFTERQRAVDQGLDNAKSVLASAKAALRAARESGDLEAETSALDDIGKANYQLNKLSDEKAYLANEQQRIETQPAPPVTPPQGDGERHPAAQAWISSHPLYSSDKTYRARATAAHAYAVSLGHVANSQGYFDTIEAELTKEYGAGHGVPATHGRTRQETSRGDVAMRPGGTTNAVGELPGERVLQTEFGPIHVGRNHEGKPLIRMAPEMKKDFIEAAKWNNMTLAEYAQAQIQIAEERAGGQNPGLYGDKDIAVYR